MKTMLFNPYSGKPRDPRDITSDPEGVLMMDPDEPLRPAAASTAAPDLREAARQFLNLTIADPTVIIRAQTIESMSAIIKAGERLRSILAAATSQEPQP